MLTNSNTTFAEVLRGIVPGDWEARGIGREVRRVARDARWWAPGFEAQCDWLEAAAAVLCAAKTPKRIRRLATFEALRELPPTVWS